MRHQTTNSKGQLHSINDQPSVITSTQKMWHKNGKLHRIGNPALINTDPDHEYCSYYENGLLHRIGEPAVIGKHIRAYYQNGRLHNDKGPAIIEDSLQPAIEEYWLNGSFYTKETWEHQIQLIEQRRQRKQQLTSDNDAA